MAYRGNKTGSFEEIPSQLMSGCPDGYTKNANGDCVKITSKPVEGGTEFTETTETTTPGGKETKPKGLPGFKFKWDNMTASEQEEFDDYFDFEVKARQYNIDKYGDPSVDKTSKTWIEENAKKNSLKKAEEELNIDLEKKTGIKPTYEATHITNKELKERVKKIPNKDNTDTQRELNIAPVSRMRTFGRSKYGTPKTSQFLTGIFGMKTIRDKSVEDKYSTDVESRETDIEEGTKKRRGLTWKPLQKP
jgi:hypothetical protein